MSEHFELKPRTTVKALRRAMKAFSDQALALDRVFNQTVKEAVPTDLRYHQDMQMALKAQAQYRATMKILLALEREGGLAAPTPAPQSGEGGKKNRKIRANELLRTGIHLHDQ